MATDQKKYTNFIALACTHTLKHICEYAIVIAEIPHFAQFSNGTAHRRK